MKGEAYLWTKINRNKRRKNRRGGRKRRKAALFTCLYRLLQDDHKVW